MQVDLVSVTKQQRSLNVGRGSVGGVQIISHKEAFAAVSEPHVAQLADYGHTPTIGILHLGPEIRQEKRRLPESGAPTIQNL